MDFLPLLLAQTAEPTEADAANAADATVEGATAATETATNALPSARELVDRLDILHDPMPALDYLSNLGALWPAVLGVLGLLCILNGYRWHKPVVALLAFMVGIGLGNDLASGMGRPMVIGLAVGLLLAIVAAPLLRVSVALLAGCTGGFIGANTWTGLVGTLESVQAGEEWIGAVIGFVALAMLSFMMFRFCVVLFTSVGGAFMLVFGLVALLMLIPDWQPSITDSLTTTPLLMPILTLLAAVGGFIVQHSRLKDEGVKVFGIDAEQT
ncbi:MAG: hypothetical protein AB8G96_11070 [Phycisphaerales bacterium]